MWRGEPVPEAALSRPSQRGLGSGPTPAVWDPVLREGAGSRGPSFRAAQTKQLRLHQNWAGGRERLGEMACTAMSLSWPLALGKTTPCPPLAREVSRLDVGRQ